MGKTSNSYVKKAIKSPDQIRSMFDVVAENYDLVNRVMSLGMDQRWRKIAAKSTGANKNSIVMDACTGTGDFALTIHAVTGSNVVGVDFSRDMLDKAIEKVEKAGRDQQITFTEASVDDLPFEDNYFDAITVGFGLRNTPDYRAVLREFYRVTKPGGRLVCLESNQPELAVLRVPYRKYMSSVVPYIGKIISNNYQAYKYFSESTQVFPPQKELARMMKEAGWDDVRYRNFMFGAVAMHVAIKNT